MRIKEWKPLLDSADYISLYYDGDEYIRVELDGAKRWVAFERKVNGADYEVVGFQETVGAKRYGDAFIGGSNRKTLAWVNLITGRVFIGEEPGGSL